ncbi:MAG TPA: hypothetical protein VMN38_04555 [Sphingomicrobium sp.]|nr:hypothetical protein [Sphingomicrobium sp.]
MLSIFVVMLAGPAAAASVQSTSEDQRPVPTICEEAISQESDPIMLVNLHAGQCKDYDAVSADRQMFLLDTVHDKYAQSSRQTHAIRPGPPPVASSEIERRRITDPTSGKSRVGLIPYPPPEDALPGRWTYEFLVNRVPPSRRQIVLNELGTFVLSRMYSLEPSKEERTDEEPYVFNGDYRARYVCVFDLTVQEVLAGIYIEKWLKQTVGSPKRLWAECSINTDENWHPTREPSNLFQPIALETTSDLYLFSVEVRPQWGGGGNIDHFEGRIFDLTRCAHLDACYARVMARFTSELTAAFAAPPLGARRETRPRPPGQLRFKRAFQLSNVLRGFRGPYYELSTYSLFAWQGPNENFIGGDHRTMARLFANDVKFKQHVFLQVSQGLQVSVGADGNYEEPKPQQYEAYNRAVEIAVRLAVARTTRALNGKVVNNVGIIIR